MPSARHCLTSMVCVLAALLLYFASFGPVCWLNATGSISLDAVNTVYYPLLQATRIAPRSRIWLKKYAQWRGPQTAFIFEDSGRVYFNWFDYSVLLCPSHP